MQAKESEELSVYRHVGFWRCTDAWREMETLNEVCRCGESPWARSR